MIFEKYVWTSQEIGAHASEQSRKIASRTELEERLSNFEKQFDKQEITRPPHWGGYVFYPAYYEFWQGRPHRLHDRICYEKSGINWTKFRIAP